MGGNPVSNRQGGTVIPLVIATATTPTAIYRNTDNKVFIPKLIHISNPNASDAQTLKLLDYDDTDTEGTKTITTFLYPPIEVQPKETVVLNESDLVGWFFLFGIAGYVTTSNGLYVYVAGEEV